MPLVFANGGTPTLPGVVFQNIQELYTIAENALVPAGWNVIYQPEYNQVLFQTWYNGNLANVAIQESGNNEFHIHAGFSVGNNYIAAPTWWNSDSNAIVGRFTFNNNAPNRIWITADEHTGIVIVRPAYETVFYCTYFGWLDLNNPNDVWAWVIDNLGKEPRAGARGYIAKNYTGTTNWASKRNPITSSWGYGPLSVNLFVARIAAHDVTTAHSLFNKFNLANNYKFACGQVAYNYDGPGYFRGFFKFILNGFTGLDCGTIHTRYIPESNQIAYYMAVSNGLNPQGNSEFGVLVGLS